MRHRRRGNLAAVPQRLFPARKISRGGQLRTASSVFRRHRSDIMDILVEFYRQQLERV